jgi:hypothetical protein
MKKLTLCHLLTIGVYMYSFCQDTLLFRNGDLLKAKISAVQPDMIRYKKWDNMNGPIYSEPKINVSEIKYHDGSKAVFPIQEKTTTAVPNVDPKQKIYVSTSQIGSLIDGKWSGNIYQKIAKGEYSLILDCDFGKNEFKISYPSLGCSGFWSVEKSSDTTINFREHITAGKGSCVDGIAIKLSIINGNKLECSIYTKLFKILAARGILQKQ